MQFDKFHYSIGSEITLQVFNPFYLLIKPYEVIIPTRLINSDHELRSDKALLKDEWQEFALPNAEEKQIIIMQEAGETTIMKKAKYETHIHDCVLLLQNIKTEKRMRLHGNLYQEIPVQVNVYPEKVNP